MNDEAFEVFEQLFDANEVARRHAAKTLEGVPWASLIELNAAETVWAKLLVDARWAETEDGRFRISIAGQSIFRSEQVNRGLHPSF